MTIKAGSCKLHAFISFCTGIGYVSSKVFNKWSVQTKSDIHLIFFLGMEIMT